MNGQTQESNDANATPMRYDIVADALVPVTQEWVDGVGRLFAKFGIARAKARLAIDLLNPPNGMMAKASLKDFLDAWKPEHETRGLVSSGAAGIRKFEHEQKS